MDILIYLLKVSAILTLFSMVYYVLLRRDTFHQFKRVYLMVGLLISAVLPWLYYTKTVIVEASSSSFNTSLLSAQVGTPKNSNVVETVRDALTFSWDEILLILYFLVSSILLARLIFKYIKLLFHLHKTSHKTVDNHKVHIVKESINPFSFFNHIVIGQEDYESKKFDIIFTHEKAHIKQWHSVDILVANLFCVVFWFNPLMWFYKTSMVQNLEHIADQVSIETINDKLKYQYLLLSNSFSASDLQTIQTTFFQSSIKQRIMMLNKSTTSKFLALKSIIVLPILVLFFMNFQTKVVAQEKKSPRKTKAKLNSVKYSDSIKTITTDYKVKDDSLNKNERIAIKITKDANQDFLDMTKKYLKKQYNIDVNYSQIKFNKNNQLTSIKAEVDCNDGFNGSSSQKRSLPINDFYIYRDYSKNTKSPFGLSNELPFGSSEKDKDEITYTTSVILSSEKSTKKDYSIDSEIESSDKFESVTNLIINGKSFQTDELAKKAIVLKSYKFVDEMTVEAEGEILENEDYWDYLDESMEASKDSMIRNVKVLFFDKGAKPIFLNIDKLSATKEQFKDN